MSRRANKRKRLMGQSIARPKIRKYHTVMQTILKVEDAGTDGMRKPIVSMLLGCGHTVICPAESRRSVIAACDHGAYWE